MALKSLFSDQDVRQRFARFLEVVEKRQIQRLQYLGELCVEKARLIPANIGFTDQTGNLRSSIGYAVFRDGKVVAENFEVVKSGKEGSEKGKSIAENISKKYPDGILLVVVAGMNYALKLESKGRDVLTTAELFAQTELPKMLKELADNIGKATQ